ncbi:MAG: GxxExxY protein [Pirellulales bacterium]
MAGELIVEIKAANALCDEHYAQILGYSRSARRRHGLLINFGGKKLVVRKFFFDLDDPLRKELDASHET